MKAFNILFLIATVSFQAYAHASDWSFENCQTSLHSFPPGTQYEVSISVEFSDQTGAGQGVASIDQASNIPMTCQFLTEMRYGLLGVPKQGEWILCETTVPVVEGLKFGIPFNVVSDESGKRSINPVTYIQFEMGSTGHGTLNGSLCLKRQSGR